MTKIQVLMLIGAFLCVTVGSFVWYIATWDATAREPVTLLIEPTGAIL
jgi:hypothetical protein